MGPSSTLTVEWLPAIISTKLKKFIIIALVSWHLTGLQSKNQYNMEKVLTDSAAIAAVLENDYFQGIYEGDLEKLHRVYHPGTLLFGDVKGQPYAKTLEQYLDGVKNRQSPRDSGQPFKGEIIKISVVNSIAVAEVKVKMYAFHYHEFLSFHRIDGKWLLVNKMLTDTSE